MSRDVTAEGPQVARLDRVAQRARHYDYCLAALGELSRLCQSDGALTRSLGLPVSGPPIGMFNLFRLPLGAFIGTLAGGDSLPALRSAMLAAW